MIPDRDLDIFIRNGLTYGPALRPGAVEEALVRIHQTPQQRGILPPLNGRLQTMFSATKFVVAGVIVALFGGFLITGVLTQQAQGPVPGAASEVRSDVLPGVDLEVEAVSPRLVRVLGDGERQTHMNIEDVAVAPDGDVWVMRQNGTVYRLGEPGNAFQQRGSPFVRRNDGTLWVADRRLDGERWVNDRDPFCHRPWQRLAPDGTCWQQPGYPQGRSGRWDESGRQVDSGSLDGYPGLLARSLGVGADGTVWTTLGADPFVGLASYDGSTWTPFETDAPEGFSLVGMAVAPDGVVWMSLFENGGSSLWMSWDGATWATYGPPEVRHFASIEFLPDGSPWFGRVAELVGDELRPIEVLAPIGDGTPDVKALANAADGSVWLIVDQPGEGGGLYVITPEPVTVTE